MAGLHSKNKGRKGENELVGYLRAHGFAAKRVSENGSPGPDIEALNQRLIECKRLKHPPSQVIEKWLTDVNLVAYRADRGEWTVVIRLTELLDLLDEADNGELWK